MTPAINLSRVPLTPEIIYQRKVVNISPDISKKFAMAPMRYSGVLWKLIHEKTPKSRVRLPLSSQKRTQSSQRQGSALKVKIKLKMINLPFVPTMWSALFFIYDGGGRGGRGGVSILLFQEPNSEKVHNSILVWFSFAQ